MEMNKTFKAFLIVVAIAAGVALVGHVGGYEWAGGADAPVAGDR